jgi:hypothetical protein
VAFVPFQPDVGVRLPRRRRSSSAWTPAQLSPQMWVESDQGITIVTGVSQWDDLSGNSNHLSQAAGTRQPTVVAAALNGIQGIQFDGTSDLMAAPAFTRTAPSTVFLVVRPDSWTANDFLFESGTAGSFSCFQRTATPNIAITSGVNLDNGNLAVGSFALLTAIFNGASSVSQVQSTAESNGDTGAGAANGFTLGARATTTGFSNITVMLAVVVDGVVSVANRDLMKSYVLGKYGI